MSPGLTSISSWGGLHCVFVCSVSGGTRLLEDAVFQAAASSSVSHRFTTQSTTCESVDSNRQLGTEDRKAEGRRCTVQSVLLTAASKVDHPHPQTPPPRKLIIRIQRRHNNVAHLLSCSKSMLFRSSSHFFDRFVVCSGSNRRRCGSSCMVAVTMTS